MKAVLHNCINFQGRSFSKTNKFVSQTLQQSSFDFRQHTILRNGPVIWNFSKWIAFSLGPELNEVLSSKITNNNFLENADVISIGKKIISNSSISAAF